MSFGTEHFGITRTTALHNKEATLAILDGTKPEPEHAGPYLALLITPGSETARDIAEAADFLAQELKEGQDTLDPATLIKVTALEGIIAHLHNRKLPEHQRYTIIPGMFGDAEAKLIFEAVRYTLTERAPAVTAAHDKIIAKREQDANAAFAHLSDYPLPSSPDAPDKHAGIAAALAGSIALIEEAQQNQLASVAIKDQRLKEMLAILDPPPAPSLRVPHTAIEQQ